MLGDRLRGLVDRVTRKTTVEVEFWETVDHLAMLVEAITGLHNLSVVEEPIAGIVPPLRAF